MRVIREKNHCEATDTVSGWEKIEKCISQSAKGIKNNHSRENNPKYLTQKKAFFPLRAILFHFSTSDSVHHPLTALPSQKGCFIWIIIKNIWQLNVLSVYEPNMRLKKCNF